MTLDQVADAIGVGKSMLMMVKTGKRRLSGKALYRLVEAERKAGISLTRETNSHFDLTREIKTPPDSVVREDRPTYGTKKHPSERLDEIEAVLAKAVELLHGLAGKVEELKKEINKEDEL